MVTRERVEEVLKEINLSLAQNYDASTFAKVGKHLGARALIRGHYTVQAAAASVSLAVQVIDVETGRIVGGDIVELRYTGDIKSMLDSPDCSSTEAGTLAPGTISKTGSSQGGYEVKRIRELQATLRTCKVVATGILCELMVTNLGGQQKYCIYDKAGDVTSRAVDESEPCTG